MEGSPPPPRGARPVHPRLPGGGAGAEFRDFLGRGDRLCTVPLGSRELGKLLLEPLARGRQAENLLCLLGNCSRFVLQFR